MKICTFGCGYLGLTFSCAMAQIGHEVLCIDKNDYKISNIKLGKTDFYEPNINDILLENINNEKIKLATTFEHNNTIDVYVVAVGTAEKQDQCINIDNIREALNAIINNITNYSVIVIKSTIPLGTTRKLKEEYTSKTSIEFDLVYIPDLIFKGHALEGFTKAQRVIVGTKSDKAFEIVKKMYEPINVNLIRMDEESAELSKFTISAFIAVKTSFINEIGNLAQVYDADISKIIDSIKYDDEICKYFPSSQIGYGGSRLIYDTNAIINIATKNKVDLNTIKAARVTNENQKRYFISKILKHYNYNVENKVFCIWGLSFTSNTSDTVNAISNIIVDTLLRYGATVRTYDPHSNLNKGIQCSSTNDSLVGANALIILNNWDEFKSPDFNLISNNLSDKVIFDAYGLYSDIDLSEYKLTYLNIGNNYNEQ